MAARTAQAGRGPGVRVDGDCLGRKKHQQCLWTERTLARARPAILLASGRKKLASSGATPEDVFDCLNERGYALFFVRDYLEGGEFVYSSPQNTLPAGQRGKRIEAILAAMDAAGVSHALISGMPFLKNWSAAATFRPGYYLDRGSRVVRARDTDYVVALAVQDFRMSGDPDAEKKLSRLYPFFSGFDGTDLGAVDLIVKRIKEFPGVFKVEPGEEDNEALVYLDVPAKSYQRGQRGDMARVLALSVKLTHDYRRRGEQYYCIDCESPSKETRH